MTIRLATLNDLPAIRALWRAFADEPRPYPANILASLDTFTRDVAVALAQSPATVFCFLAEDELRPLGFFLYEIQTRVYGEPHRFGFVHYAYVVPDHRREGIVARLAELCAEHALAQGLEVCEATHTMDQHVWDTFGFTDFETRATAPIAKVLQTLDHRRARKVVEKGNGFDHDPVSPEQPEGKGKDDGLL